MGTATPNSRHNTRYTVGAIQHYGGVIEVGTYVPCTLGTYTTVGDPTTFSALGTPLMVCFSEYFSRTGLSATGGQRFVWDGTNGTVRVFTTDGAEGTTTYAGSTQAIEYFAFGFADK